MKRFNPLQPDPEAVPPEEVRFLELKVVPWEDTHRLKVHVRLTPFQKPPDLEFEIWDIEKKALASAFIVENIDFEFVITLHLRVKTASNQDLTLHASILYEDTGVVHEKEVAFHL